MAYGNGQGQKFGGNNQAKPVAAAIKPITAAAPAATATTGTSGNRENDLFVGFKNKGQGYSVTLKEDLTIPAGTKVALFEDTLTGKDGTNYQVIKVKKMPPRDV